MSELIPIDKIIVAKRLRDETHSGPELQQHLADLCESITHYGLLQPILIDQHNVLQDGWCRFTAWSRLAKLDPVKYASIPVHRRENLTEAEYYELELETNLRRLELTWRENVVSVCRIHRARVMDARRNGTEWTQEMTGELLGGYSKSYVSNCVTLISGIRPDCKDLYAECNSITDAMRVYYQKLEDAAVAEQARRLALTQSTTPTESMPEGLADLLADLPPEAGGVPSDGDLPAPPPPQITIKISERLFLGDSCRDILPQWPESCVDHIITDPPYGIDMDNLQQTNSGMDVSSTAAEHNVKENEDLFHVMFPACYRVLRDSGFMVLWCDQMQWQLLYDLAIAAGFGVQRWPIVWCKPQGMNQMAHVNVTKATEIAMVCRKGKAQLPKPVSSNWLIHSNDVAKASNPFAKPAALWNELFDMFTTPGQTILDPFAGEGSSIMAGILNSRKMLGIEKNQTHYNYLITTYANLIKTHYPNAILI